MKFVVIEGIDGSGKSTQIKLLTQYLTEKNIKYKYLHFPRTESPIFGELIAKFLRGDLGNLNQVDPYLVALIYAGDRNDAKNLIKHWKEENYFVLLDRYVCSNIAFQCAKIADKNKSNELKKWILNLEYDYFKIPQPDLNIFLDVPFEFTKNKLIASRNEDSDRAYLNGQKDIHEEDLEFQKRVRDVYIEQVNEFNNFMKIECSIDNYNILPPSEIFNKIISGLKSLSIL